MDKHETKLSKASPRESRIEVPSAYDKPPPDPKENVRNKIQSDVEDFLNKGGKITLLGNSVSKEIKGFNQ